MSSVNPEGIAGFYSYTFDIGDTSDTWHSSDEFTINGVDHCWFEIKLCRSWGTDRFQVLVKKSHEESDLAKITVSILGEETTKIVRNWRKSCPFINEGVKPYPDYIKVDCGIIWYGTTEDSIPVKVNLSPFSGFQNIHLNSSLSDLKISIGRDELSAHKVVLAAYSPIFLSMFETDMKEKRESRIVVEGIELNVMKIVLTILYTGHDEDLDELEKAKNVLVVAERYGMKALKRLCEWKLFKKLTVSNALDVLDKADNCNAGTLRTGSMNFIVKHKQLMAESEDWKVMCRNKPNLMGELIQSLMITE